MQLFSAKGCYLHLIAAREFSNKFKKFQEIAFGTTFIGQPQGYWLG
jgi:hypothetical protein